MNQLRRFSLVSIGYITSSFLAFVFYFMFAKILPVNDFGEFIYLFSISGVAVIIARLGLGQTSTIQIAKGNKVFASQANVFHFILLVISSIFLYFINPFLSILTIGISFFMMDLNLLLGDRDYKKYLMVSISCRIFQIIVSFFLYYVLGLVGILLATGIVTILHGHNFMKSLFSWNLKFDQIKKHFVTILHNFGVESAQILPTWTDKLLIVPLFGFSLAGIYQFGYQVLLVLGIMPMVIYTYLIPEESSGASTRSVIVGGLAFSALLTVVSFFASPLIIDYFFPEFYDSVALIQIFSFGTIPLTVINIVNAKLQSKESKWVGLGAIVRISSHLILILVLWNIMHIEGLAIAALASILIHMVYLLIVYFHAVFKQNI